MIENEKNAGQAGEKPMRITRVVSVLLNGVVLSKLAMQNGNDVNVMAASLMLGMSDTVKRNILSHEFSHVNHSLRNEIGRRINLPQAI
jgi:hypothetical protein